MTASINSILSTARSALVTHQTAISVISHNIANAETDGYSRQRAEIAPGMPVPIPEGMLGTGVQVRDVSRLRDGLLDIGYRQSNSKAGYWQRRAAVLSQVEALHGDPVTGLSSELDAFWDAWGDLANDPSNPAVRVILRKTGQAVVDQFHRLAGGIDRIEDTTGAQLKQDVTELNRIARDIAQLNTRIASAESTGNTAADLRDERDLAIDRLSTLAGVQVTERPDHTVGIQLGGVTLVDGDHAATIRVVTAGGGWALENANGTPVGPAGGEVGASLELLTVDLPQAMNALDDLARAFAQDVNAVHAGGTNPLGQTGVLFFDDAGGNPSAVTAWSLSLSADVTADAQSIASGTGIIDPLSGLPVWAPGNNDIALSIAGLRTAGSASFGGQSINDAFADEVARVGSELREAQDGSSIHEALAAQADQQRMSVSGVNTDEELIQLIRFQNAYSAAARVVTAADEMLQTILDMKR